MNLPVDLPENHYQTRGCVRRRFGKEAAMRVAPLVAAPATLSEDDALRPQASLRQGRAATGGGRRVGASVFGYLHPLDRHQQTLNARAVPLVVRSCRRTVANGASLTLISLRYEQDRPQGVEQDLAGRGSEPQAAVPYCQKRRDHDAALELAQHRLAAIGALAIAVLYGKQLLFGVDRAPIVTRVRGRPRSNRVLKCTSSTRR
jgi:hypothetical protein